VLADGAGVALPVARAPHRHGLNAELVRNVLTIVEDDHLAVELPHQLELFCGRQPQAFALPDDALRISQV
jgi:hypothetical protein